MKLFAIRRKVGQNVYAEAITAKDWDEAESRAEKIGVVLDDEIIEQIDSICTECGNDITEGCEEWSEFIK